MTGILTSGVIYPSLKATSPSDVRYGEGVYVSDIAPGSMTVHQLSRRLLGLPWLGRRLTHFVEIDVDGLPIVIG